MKYQIVAQNNGVWLKIEVNGNDKDLIIALESLGYQYNGPCNRKQLRDELQGQPMFNGLLGPMYDGPDCIRYENQAANNFLSQ